MQTDKQQGLARQARELHAEWTAILGTGRVTARTPSDNDGVSLGVVAIAVAMAACVSVATGWFFLRGSWGRRTPPLER